MDTFHIWRYRIISALQMGALSCAVGICSGAVCAVFGRGLLLINNFRDVHRMFLIPLLPLLGLCIVFMYDKWGGGAEEGMNIVFAAGLDDTRTIPFRMMPLAVGATWFGHIGGASVGREGVACQIGAVIGYTVGKLVKNKRFTQTLIIAGMAGGFAGLFRTPVAAVCFALEVMIAGRLFYYALLPAIIAAGSASAVSGLLGLTHEYFPLPDVGEAAFTPPFVAKLTALALLFCAAGQLFAHLLKYCHERFQVWLPNKYKRIFIVGAVLSGLLLVVHKGRYAGLSFSITDAVFEGGNVFMYDWILKLLFTVVCLSAGFQGGELTPLFIIGSAFGYIVAPLFGLPPLLCAALGHGAVFGSATNTLLAPIAITGAVFGFQYTPLFAFVCAVAFYCNGNHGIYRLQRAV
ncbi:hypothetical protein HMPREF1221_01808 [Treponema socranskii subsp. paredis ATCC 35535]|nr:hypothetical protein HMPREF1221_01808 [Treponema socranskii subsp. paredis ATCC 35535]